MNNIKAIGFDLFNTLITAKPQASDEALSRMTRSLWQSGFDFDYESLIMAHREAALQFLEQTRRDGRETHNRFWISAASQSQGYIVPPDDARIGIAVEAYFSAFVQHCHLIPGTSEILGTLKGSYRLGLLSNFTHAPAAIDIIEQVGLSPFFDVVLISGELGYRKPHPMVFRRLIECLGVEKGQVAYIGDDLGPDITGAQRAGLQPIWTTLVQDRNMRFTGSPLSGATQWLDCKVPRISAWEDLLSLLKRQ